MHFEKTGIGPCEVDNFFIGTSREKIKGEKEGPGCPSALPKQEKFLRPDLFLPASQPRRTLPPPSGHLFPNYPPPLSELQAPGSFLDFPLPSRYYPHRLLLSNPPCSEGRYGSEILRPHFLKERWGFFVPDLRLCGLKGGPPWENSNPPSSLKSSAWPKERSGQPLSHSAEKSKP